MSTAPIYGGSTKLVMVNVAVSVNTFSGLKPTQILSIAADSQRPFLHDMLLPTMSFSNISSVELP